MRCRCHHISPNWVASYLLSSESSALETCHSVTNPPPRPKKLPFRLSGSAEQQKNRSCWESNPGPQNFYFKIWCDNPFTTQPFHINLSVPRFFLLRSRDSSNPLFHPRTTPYDVTSITIMHFADHGVSHRPSQCNIPIKLLFHLQAMHAQPQPQSCTPHLNLRLFFTINSRVRQRSFTG